MYLKIQNPKNMVKFYMYISLIFTCQLALIYACWCVCYTGLEANANNFLIYLGTLLMTSMAAAGVAFLIGVLVDAVSLANIATVFTYIFMLVYWLWMWLHVVSNCIQLYKLKMHISCGVANLIWNCLSASIHMEVKNNFTFKRIVLES